MCQPQHLEAGGPESMKIRSKCRRRSLQQAGRAPRSDEQHCATPPGGGYRALVVADEIPLAEVMELAREIDPDVVILDLALPGIDALEVPSTMNLL